MLRIVLLSSICLLHSTTLACLPGLGLGGGGGGGGCCQSAAPSCGSPCGGGGGPPPPVYAAAPLAPAPFPAFAQGPPPPPPPPPAPYVQGPPPPPPPQVPYQPYQSYTGVGGRVGGAAYQVDPRGGQVGQGGAYLADPVRQGGYVEQQQQRQVQPLPLLGQPVAYEKPAVIAQPVVLNTQQVLTKVMPVSAVLDERIVQPTGQQAEVTSVQSSGYDVEEQNTVIVSQGRQPLATAASSSSSSSASGSNEHQQVRVPSSLTRAEVAPEVETITQVVQTYENRHQVAVETSPAPEVVPVAVQVQQYNYPAPNAVVSAVSSTVLPNVVPEVVSNVVPEQPKITPVEERIEIATSSDYDQPRVVPDEQQTVNELLATLDQVETTQAGNLDFNAVTITPGESNHQQAQNIQEDNGDDYDSPSLNEDRKDVPAISSATVGPTPLENIPEESAPIIPQTVKPFYPQVITEKVYLRPITPVVAVTTDAPNVVPNVVQHPAYVTPGYENSVEVNEARPEAPQVPLRPEPAVIQTITDAPPTPSTTAEYFENITGEQETTTIAPTTSSTTQETTTTQEIQQIIKSGESEDEEEETIETSNEILKSSSNEIVKSSNEIVKSSNEIVKTSSGEEEITPTDPNTETIPTPGEYGSKFAKVQGTGIQTVNQPIELTETEAIENPYRRMWIF